MPDTTLKPTMARELQHQKTAFNYSAQKVQGVSLGGWLVLEPWITPSIFESAGDAAVDEWTLGETLGKPATEAVLARHWNTFITQQDFQAIARAGLNHVRIPIGYWALAPLPEEPFVQGQLPVLDSAIVWARDAGLKVLIDLHGAPGSQNGFDNSGRKGPINWQKGDTVKQTLAACKELVDRYTFQEDVVVAIEALNEPSIPGGIDPSQLKQFYCDVWDIVRMANNNTMVVLHDGFMPVDSWNGFMTPSTGFWNVVMDTHHYEAFGESVLAMNADQHISNICQLSKSQLHNADKHTVIGEWTAAMTDCARHLNGRGLGARFDGTLPGSHAIGSCAGKSTGSVAALDDTEKASLRRFIEAQLDAYEATTAGWLFWTWKTEGSPEWDMQQLLANGVFPQPVSARQFGNQCGRIY